MVFTSLEEIEYLKKPDSFTRYSSASAGEVFINAFKVLNELNKK